jgi:hypothetical protein
MLVSVIGFLHVSTIHLGNVAPVFWGTPDASIPGPATVSIECFDGIEGGWFGAWRDSVGLPDAGYLRGLPRGFFSLFAAFCLYTNLFRSFLSRRICSAFSSFVTPTGFGAFELCGAPAPAQVGGFEDMIEALALVEKGF